MSNNIEEKTIELARSVSIATLLGLKQFGRRISICCPFHNEKSPSFVIYPDNSYHCYGCSKRGSNAIDFLMEVGATFSESIEELKKYF